ncbi:cytochrome P450 [Amycolatopsis samaneae]|uniref:Cytochrome P450 n=1 Tax=Amycolatopsis samaneae TaxID=664691 RepID=A0ABW5GSU1_9PSEU
MSTLENPAEVRSFPMPRTCPFAPPEQYARLRAEEPVSRVVLGSGRVAWLLTRYEDVRKLLLAETVTSDRRHPNFPLFFELPPEQLAKLRPVLVSLDPPAHAAQRRLVVPEFTLRRMRALRPRIQEIVDEHVDAILAGDRPADLVGALAVKVPALVICELLGVPYADREFFQYSTTAIISRSATPEEAGRANAELQEYFDKLVTTKEADPGDDLIGRMIVKNRESDTPQDHEQLVGMARMLLVAGHEATSNMISLGTVALLEHPEQLAALREDPALAEPAVDELLRYFSIADQLTSRVLTADVEVGGTLLKAGDGVIGVNAAANRDPSAFACPDELDIHRNARGHLAFGYGIHQCVGQNLARVELEVVYRTLFTRIPGLRLAIPAAELPYKDATVFGLHELPVTW